MTVKTNYFMTIMMLAVSIILLKACKEEDPPPEPVATFQYEASETNYLEISFTNFSSDGESFAWDFGDGNTSTEENPVHVYSEAGTYNVTLTVTNATGTATFEEEVNVVDPLATYKFISGEVEKTWIIQREGIALGIGPEAGDVSWWNFGGTAPLGDRPCILDDEYKFTFAGNFELESNNTIFHDAPANGGFNDDLGEGCFDEAEAGFEGDEADFGNGGDYTFEVDAEAKTLTILGSGAYIALPNKTEAGDNPAPVATKTYQINKMVDTDEVDSLQLVISGDGFAWTFNLVSYEEGVSVPPIPQPQPTSKFVYTNDGLTATFTNTSTNADTYTWDFGDGSTSSEKDPVHTFSAEGFYDVKLTVANNTGVVDEKTKMVAVGTSVMTATDLASDAGVTWNMAATDGGIRVGPGPGNGEWYAMPGDVLAERDCWTNDLFIFLNDGTFEYDAQGDLWAEDYVAGEGNPTGCIDETELSGIWTGLGSDTYTFEFTEAAGDANPMVKVIGTGAFIGFSKGYNGGEYTLSTSALQTEVTYEVIKYVNDGTKKLMEIAVDISENQDGTAYWTMILQSN